MHNPPWTAFARPDPALERATGEVIYVNSRYQVNVSAWPDRQPFGYILHLSIKRRDKHPIRNWRDLQKIKNEIVGAETEAVEIFPAETRLADSANQYHLFAFAGGYRLPFGFSDRFVSESPMAGVVQEPFEPEHRPLDLGERDTEANAAVEEAQRIIAIARNGNI